MIPMPPNPFQPEQPADPLADAKHLRVYDDNGKLRVEPIEKPDDLPQKDSPSLIHLRQKSIYLLIHVDIDTDDAQKQAIAERVATMYFKYTNPDMLD